VSVVNEHYDIRGNKNYGIVIRCPRLVGNRLVYFDHSKNNPTTRLSWVIRDFIAGFQLIHTDSDLTVEAIEDDADYSEFPPWFNVDKADEWRTYLLMRTTVLFKPPETPVFMPIRESVSRLPPERSSGEWSEIIFSPTPDQ
jgi:hypothetical protein